MFRTLFIALAVLLLLPLEARNSYAYEKEIKGLSSAVASAMDKVGSRKRVAIADFTDPKGNVTELGKYIADELSADLKKSAQGFEVMERAEFTSVLSRSNLSISSTYLPDTVKRLGQEAKVGAVVTGSITPFSGSIRVSISVINTYQAKVVASASADIPRKGRVAELLASGPGSFYNLTGVWSCDDGGTYYLRQIGGRIWWYGEASANNPYWSNVSYGDISGNEIRLEWTDVPKGGISGYGTLILDVLSNNKITVRSVTGGFGGRVWTR